MTNFVVQTITEIATFVVSIGVSAFIAGSRWGQVQQDLQGMKERLIRIESMFTMKLKDD